jgi:hypothetical protein
MAQRSAVTGREHDYWRELRWPDRETGPYVVRVYFDTISGRPECVGMEMWGKTLLPKNPVKGVTPLTAQAVRIPLGEITAESRKAFLDMADRWSAGSPDPKLLKAMNETREEWDAQRSGRPRRYDAKHWAQVAQVYQEAWQRGERPTAAVVAKFGVSKNVAAKWVNRLRSEMHLLPPTTRGKPAGTAAAKKRRAK